ncbi:MAG: inorganic diphosphatase [bacterium]|nr:inorganic diphosphatase [bacterium]
MWFQRRVVRLFFYVLFPFVLIAGCQTDYLNLLPYDDAGQLQMVVEIPAGSRAKFELNKQSGRLEQDIKDGKPRFIEYLPYPAHYGFIPGTLLDKANGGDGDPLDVVLLDGDVRRGDVVPIRIIGVLYLVDGGENDHKLIAVNMNGVFNSVHSLAALDQQFPGVSAILATFFVGYKGSGVMEVRGFGSTEQATALLNQAKPAHK